MHTQLIYAYFAILLLLPTQSLLAKDYNSFLDERIALNKHYKKKYTNEAKEMILAKQLVPMEEEIGQEWVDFLIHVKNSKDITLKVHVLRLELLEEIRNSLYDKEYAETEAEEKAAQANLAKWQQKLQEFNTFHSKQQKDK